MIAVPPTSVHIVGATSQGGEFQDGPTQARLDAKPQLAVIGVLKKGRRTLIYADPQVKPLRFRGRLISASQRLPWPEQTSARWSLVEPHAWREPNKRAPNGVTTRFHSNVSMEPATFGKWLGYDEVSYFETPLGVFQKGKGSRTRAATAKPSRKEDDLFGGLGTVRYRVEVSVDGKMLATPGASARDQYGILPSVHRVSIRMNDSFLGHLSAYFLVPEIFGSAGRGKNNQTERFIGADCADVLTGAIRRAGYTKVWHSSVANLPKYTKPVIAPVVFNAEGMPAAQIKGVKLGDLLRINYGGALQGSTPRRWDHVAALYEDRSDPNGPHQGAADGLLDGFDVVVHMGHPRLVVEPLKAQLPATIDVVRWDPKKIGRRSRAP